MGKLKALDENLNLAEKRIILRVDLNVPMKNGYITESSRIEKILPTINLLIEKQAKIVILSHIGRPKGKVVENMSLEPISKKLASLINSLLIDFIVKIKESSTIKCIPRSKIFKIQILFVTEIYN